MDIAALIANAKVGDIIGGERGYRVAAVEAERIAISDLSVSPNFKPGNANRVASHRWYARGSKVLAAKLSRAIETA